MRQHDLIATESDECLYTFMNCSKRLMTPCTHLSDADNQVRLNVREKLPNTGNPRGMTLRRFVKRKTSEKA